MVADSIIRSFKSGSIRGGAIFIREIVNGTNRGCGGRKNFAGIPMHEMQNMTKLSCILGGEGNRGGIISQGDRLRATRKAKADGASLLSPRIGWANWCELGFGISAYGMRSSLGNGCG